MKAAVTALAELVIADRGARRRRLGAEHRGREVPQHVGVVGVALRQRLNAGPAVRQYPVADQIRRQRLDRHQLGRETSAQLIEIVDERRNQRRGGLAPGGGIRACETLQQAGNLARSLGAGTGAIARGLGKLVGGGLDRGERLPGRSGQAAVAAD